MSGEPPKKRRSHTTVKIVEMNQPTPELKAKWLGNLLKSNAANRAAKAATQKAEAAR